MRKLPELLQIILNNINMINDWRTDGLCLIPLKLEHNNIITTKEKIILKKHLDKTLKPLIDKLNDNYAWEQGLIKPRKQWLEKQIQIYNNKKQ